MKRVLYLCFIATLLVGCAALAMQPAMIVSITTHAPGMTAELMESDVTNLIERVLRDVSGVSRVRSMSSQGKSYIEVGFSGVSAEAALPVVHAALTKQSARLPASVATPVLRVDKALLASSP